MSSYNNYIAPITSDLSTQQLMVLYKPRPSDDLIGSNMSDSKHHWLFILRLQKEIQGSSERSYLYCYPLK